jgi:hypothetical protein
MKRDMKYQRRVARWCFDRATAVFATHHASEEWNVQME